MEGLPGVDDDIVDLMVLTTRAQVQAVGNLTRFQILGVLAGRAATVTQLAAELGVLKGSVSHHLRVLSEAGLIRLVRTAKVRGGTERYWGRTARAFEVAASNPAYGDRALLLRTVAEDLDASSTDSQELMVHRLRLSRANQRLLRDRLKALVQDMTALEDLDQEPMTLTIAVYRPERRNVPSDAAPHGSGTDGA